MASASFLSSKSLRGGYPSLQAAYTARSAIFHAFLEENVNQKSPLVQVDKTYQIGARHGGRKGEPMSAGETERCLRGHGRRLRSYFPLKQVFSREAKTFSASPSCLGVRECRPSGVMCE